MLLSRVVLEFSSIKKRELLQVLCEKLSYYSAHAFSARKVWSKSTSPTQPNQSSHFQTSLPTFYVFFGICFRFCMNYLS